METINLTAQALLVNILLLLLGGLQGLLLCYLLLRKKAYRHGYGFLVAYLAVMVFQIVLKVMDKVWMMQNINPIYQTSYLFPFLYGPLAWLFVRKIAKPEEQFKLADGLHFLPFALGFFALIFQVAWEWMAWTRNWSGLALHLTMLGFYHFYALRFMPKSLLEMHPERAAKLKWVQRFILHSWWICSAICVVLVLMYQTNPALVMLRFGFVLLTGFIYWVSYCALQRPSQFFEEAPPLNGYRVLSGNVKKYANSTLKSADALRIKDDLRVLMQEKKAFTDPELTIEKLAALVRTNRHTLSQVLNERLELSFFDYVNGLRVEEVKRLLKAPAHRHLKIAAVAYDAGFKSMSVFNSVFKKLTGQKPSEFRKSVQKSVPMEQE